MNSRILFILILCFLWCSTLIGQTDSSEINDSISAKFLHSLPTRDLHPDIYGFFSGSLVQSYRGVPFYHVQGGRVDEVAYEFEDINIRSDYTGLPAVRFIPEILQSIALDKTPNAAQSNASAMVNHQFLQPGNGLHFSLRGTSDNFTNPYKKRMGTYSYGYNNVLLTGNGQILGDKLGFVFGLEFEQFDDHYRKFWDGFTFTPSPNDQYFADTDLPLTFSEVFATDQIVIKPGNIPEASRDNLIFNGSISYNSDFGQFNLVHLQDRKKYQDNPTPIMHIFNLDRIPEVTENTHVSSLQYQNELPGKINLSAGIDFLNTKSKTEDPILGDAFYNYDDNLPYENLATTTVDTNGWDFPNQNVSVNGFDFGLSNAMIANFSRREENRFSGHFELTKTHEAHKISIGFNFEQNKHRYFYYKGTSTNDFNELRERLKSGTSLGSNSFSYHLESYGYDLIGNEIEKTDGISEGPKSNTSLSTYLQDEWTFNNSDVTFGFHYTALNAGAYREKNLSRPYFPTQFPVDENEYEIGKTFHYLLPRLHLREKVSSNTSISIFYGQFVNQPRLSDVYLSWFTRIRDLWGGWFEAFPRGFNAEPVKSQKLTTSFQHNINTNTTIVLGAFYRNSDSWLQSEYIEIDETTFDANYNTLLNTGEMEAKGIEIGLSYFNQNIQFLTNYTFSNTKGTASFPNSNSAEIALDRHFGTEPGERNKLEFNQPHRFNALFSAQSPLTHWFFKNFSLSSLIQINSGHSYWQYFGFSGIGSSITEPNLLADDHTARSRQSRIMITTPWIFEIDLMVEKAITIQNLKTKWFIAAQNILNRKNIEQVYWRSGKAEYDGVFVQTPELKEYWPEWYGESALSLYQHINVEHRQHYTLAQGGDLYGHPREIRFGVQIDFDR